ncbi:DUF3800 domain-containing protein [Sphingomonas sp. R1]|uniref:DUF3800 domain-containing protein n=1 Tax=Sphingomonas sp. R1 TaxID=399176 RepID=UPI002224BC03|nr:DUF3800 domain-containing protein [Sphingomonas sp. R1]UYY78664.1 DUF3800 domain-containing protein [Sphingomonas sp. R1]
MTKAETAESGWFGQEKSQGRLTLYDYGRRSNLKRNLRRSKRNLGAGPSGNRQKNLHCSNLDHFQKLHFIRRLSKHKKRLFGVISYKKTLGGYKDAIDDNHKLYYNKCAQYLLERVGSFMKENDIPSNNLNIVFEEGNFDYDKLRGLLYTCQRNPKHPNTALLSHIEVENISVKAKPEEPLLQMADLVAHALYKCVDKQDKNHFISEPRYLRELSPRFFGDPKTRSVAGAGLYLVHKIDDLDLDPEVKEVILAMLAEPRSNSPVAG